MSYSPLSRADDSASESTIVGDPPSWDTRDPLYKRSLHTVNKKRMRGDTSTQAEEAIGDLSSKGENALDTDESAVADRSVKTPFPQRAKHVRVPQSRYPRSSTRYWAPTLPRSPERDVLHELLVRD